MGFKNYYSEMKTVKEDMLKVTLADERRPTFGSGLAAFWERAKFSVRLIFLEKELIVFALLQWLCVAAGYYLWIQMIDWIPAAAWESASKSDKGTIGGLILFLWSFVCVGLVSFPLGVLTGCMGAVHFLHRQGKESTVGECLRIVMPKAWPLWIFHWIDGWWTMMRILDRLPKKNDRRGPAQKAFSEAVYYAWKVATIGILPGLVTGRGLVDAGKRSIRVVEARFFDVMMLRAGYSTLCWIVGVAAYAGAIYFFIAFPGLVNFKAAVSSQMYVFYFWVAVPALTAAAAVMLFLRPIYVISSCDIYADYVAAQQENLMLPPPPGQASGDSAVFAAVLLALAVMFVYFFREDLGLMRLLAR